MKRIDEKNMLPNTCSKKQATSLDTMKIDDNDECEIIEEVYRRDKFDKEFDIGMISECEYDEKSSEDEKWSSGESNNEDGDELRQILLVVAFLLYEYDSEVINLL